MTATYTIDDPRPIAAEAPYTFFLPTASRLAALEAGDQVKLTFRAVPADRKFGAERMWVTVTQVEGEHLTGTLLNTPDDMPQLSVGAVVRFNRHDVLDINWDDPDKGSALPYDAPRQYWERCLVDTAVQTGDAPIGFLYREAPDMSREDNNYPDSGWRIRQSQLGMTDAEIDAIDFEYVALGAVLNTVDDWLHLIDHPVGSRFWRNPETGKYEADS